MEDQIVSLFEFLFNLMSGISSDFSSFAGSSTSTVVTTVNSVATSIKPIGYALLALFALIEMAQLCRSDYGCWLLQSKRENIYGNYPVIS